MTERFVKNFNGCLRSDFTGLSATDAISYSKDRTFAIGEKGIFV